MERLELGRAEIYRRVKDGKLKAEKVERQLHFEATEVERYGGVVTEEGDALHAELDRWLTEFASSPEAAGEGPLETAEEGDAGTEADKVKALGELIVAEAARSGATDVYLDPVHEGARLLIAGVGSVREAARFGAAVAGPLREWLESLGALPEEGAIREALVQREVIGTPRQYRLAVVPTALGELVHLHDFASSVADGLEGLGYSEFQARWARQAVGGQPGLYVVAGPPDPWGERHRLAMARELSAAGRLVVSVEHRIHFHSELLVQLETGGDPEVFPGLWRRALDMRPDYLFVDEVRDKAEAACLLEGVQAGAVVICQVSATAAEAALRRLLALELDGGDIGRDLLGCCERRVLRALCPHCRVPLADGDAIARLGLTAGKQMWSAGSGCSRCVNGWQGHRAVFGLVPAAAPILSWLESGAESPAPQTPADELSLSAAVRAAALAGEVDAASVPVEADPEAG